MPKRNINYDRLEIRSGYQTYLKHGGFANILYSIQYVTDISFLLEKRL